MKLYKNGNLVDSATGVDVQNNDATSYIGRFRNGNNFYGKIDAVTLWHRALENDDILEIMNLIDPVNMDG